MAVFSRTEPRSQGSVRSWWARVQAQAQATAWLPDWPEPTAAGSEVRVSSSPRWSGATPTTTPAGAADDARAARTGQAVHRVLEWAAGAAGAADLLALSEAAAAQFALPAITADRVRQAAAAVLHSPSCARFFGGAGLRWAGNEVPVPWLGQLLRIDRLVALEEGGQTTWWVLDYKLRSDPASIDVYRQQLEGYVAAVQALQPADAVRGAFITGLGQLVEL